MNANASFYLATSPTGTQIQADAGEPGTLGYSFTTGSSVGGYQVDGLGIYDWGNDGLGLDHAVGIWTSGGVLVASATVLTSDSLASGFRWDSAISGPALLSASTTYVIGALYAQNDPDHLVGIIGSPPSATMADGFTMGTSRVIEGTSYALTFPTATYVGGFGPNAELTAVPEPTTMIAGALLLLPFGASTLRIIRKRMA
jgi:hypothetical protein